MRYYLPLWMPLFSFLAGCTFHLLDIQTQYLTHENLASYAIGTPDTRLEHPDVGQRLLIQWSLPRAWVETPLSLYLVLRYRNHEEVRIRILLEKSKGFYLYNLINEDYVRTGGILTYRAEIKRGDCQLATWKHPLWSRLIQFDCSRVNGND